MKSSLAFAALVALLIVAQDTSKCPEATLETIQTCSDQVHADEGKAPCSGSDWNCICQIQEGLLACHDPCPETTESDAIKFNNENCKGQHGVTNAAGGNPSGTYTLSHITTTGEGSSGATPSPSVPNVSSTAFSTSAAVSSSAASTGPASAASSATSTAPAQSSSPAPNSNTGGAFSGSSSNLGFALVLSGLFLGAVAEI